MPALLAGTQAPTFTLPTIDGQLFSLKDELRRGPVLLAFFKVSCPVCQFALPFVERIYKAAAGKNVTIVGISQNDKKDTQAFIKQFGLSFPVLLEDTKSYDVSNAYGLTNVPSLFWISPDGEIRVSSVGWVRKDLEEVNRTAAKSNGNIAPQLFQPGEQIPDFRAG